MKTLKIFLASTMLIGGIATIPVNTVQANEYNTTNQVGIAPRWAVGAEVVIAQNTLIFANSTTGSARGQINTGALVRVESPASNGRVMVRLLRANNGWDANTVWWVGAATVGMPSW